MKVHVIAKASALKFVWCEADKCIDKAKEYDVKKEIMDRDFIFSFIYKLKLEGTEENIKSFLGYLKMMGFRIKQI